MKMPRLRAKSIAVLGLIGLGAIFSATKPSAAIRESFHLDMPGNWERVSMWDVDQAWLLASDAQRSTVTVTSERTEFEIPMPSSREEEAAIVMALEKEIELPYKMFGIRDWKVQSHKLVPWGQKSFYLEISGSYLTSRSVEVGFFQRIFYSGEMAYSVIFSQDLPEGKSLDIRQASSVLSSFRAGKMLSDSSGKSR